MGLDAKLLRYAKAQAGAALAFPLGFFETAVSLRAEVGALLPWGPGFAGQPTCISDRRGPAAGEGVCCGSWPVLGLRFQQCNPPATAVRDHSTEGRQTAAWQDCAGRLHCAAVVMRCAPVVLY